MGHKYDPDSKRQQRMRIPRCAFCGKGLRAGAVQVDGKWRHKKCADKVVEPHPQPTTIEDAYRWPIYWLNDEWKQKLKEWIAAGKPGWVDREREWK